MCSNIGLSKSIHMTSVWNSVMLLVKISNKVCQFGQKTTFSKMTAFQNHFENVQLCWKLESGKNKGDSRISRGVSLAESQQKIRSFLFEGSFLGSYSRTAQDKL